MSLKVLLLSRAEQPLKHFHILSLKKKRQRVLGTFRLFSKLILSVADFFSRNQPSNFIYSDGFTVREKNIDL